MFRFGRYLIYCESREMLVPMNFMMEKKMPFKDNQANLVTIILAIHHVKNIDLFFKDLSRITKKVG